ncbi:MAG: penicillin-binding protein 1A [Candidatus Kapaibacterium sp.]
MSVLSFITPSRVARIAGIGLVVITLGVIGTIWYGLSSGLPTLEQLENPPQELATQVYSADGVMLDLYATTRRTNLSYDSIPPAFLHALIATEDRAYYDHWGVHLTRIFKAAVKNVFAMRTKEGASTITQQLARNLYFTREQTVTRKIREAWTALQVERAYTKNEILEMYANTVYYGRGAYGLRVAAHSYFNKEPMKLTTAECAYLVGLFKAPEKYGSDDSLGIERRNLILGMMLEQGFLTQARWAEATSEGLRKPAIATVFRGIAPHFVEMIRQQLSTNEELSRALEGHDVYRDGLVIHTTLDSRVQKAANDAVGEHLADFQRQFDASWIWRGRGSLQSDFVERAIRRHASYIGAASDRRPEIARRLRQSPQFIDSVKRIATTIQTGLVVIDPRSGKIVGMVGASPQSMRLNSAARYSLNHVTQIRRQPGSSFKPFVYASALEQQPELTPESLIESGPFSFTLEDGTVWAPGGSRKGGGAIPLRTALKFSTNTVAARLVTLPGYTTPQNVIELARKMGITSPMQAVPSIALGSLEVSPIEITSAYGCFINQGMHTSTTFITRIEDRMGNVLYEDKQSRRSISEACSPQVAESMISMMRGVVDGGTASSIRRFFTGEAAGKTGTTNDFADAWFVGMTPQLVCGIWVGFDDQRIKFTGDYGQGGRAAAPIFGRLMQKVYANPANTYRQRSFAIISDSTDQATDIDIANPAREEISDSPTDETQP